MGVIIHDPWYYMGVCCFFHGALEFNMQEKCNFSFPMHQHHLLGTWPIHQESTEFLLVVIYHFRTKDKQN